MQVRPYDRIAFLPKEFVLFYYFFILFYFILFIFLFFEIHGQLVDENAFENDLVS